jgi:fumarate hydratase, class II
MTDGEQFRVERDSMGEVKVPRNAKWGAQTQRAIDNFPISGMPLERDLVRALGLIKGASARVKADRGLLDPDKAKAIADAADEVARGDWDAEFPIDTFQTGSGTSSNMNANEVIASLATERLGGEATVHPNDDVNDPLSSNDQFPSAMHIAACKGVLRDLVPALAQLAASLEAKSAEFVQVVKSGRTHLMDATPVTLGQEFAGYAAQIRYGIERLEATLPRLAELPLGGTAVGTGINAPAGFGAEVIRLLAAETGLPLTEARDHFEAQGARDALVELSGALRTIAIGLNKISNDIRLMASGPRTGLSELVLPDLQPGSSIMPGKVNPVLCEAVCQVVAQVIGYDAAVAWAGANGNFELNVLLPVMSRDLLQSIRLIASVSRVFAEKCIDGIIADVDRCREYAESSPAIVTPLNHFVGYDEAARIAKQALAERKTIRQVVIERGHVGSGAISAEQLDEALDVLSMTHPKG